VPRFRRFWALAHPLRASPQQVNKTAARKNPTFPRLHVRFRRPIPESAIPQSGNKIANRGPRLLPELFARKGSPAVVVMISVEVAGLAPGVTLDGVKLSVDFPGKPFALSAMAPVKLLFTEVNVSPYIAAAPARMVIVAGDAANVKSGGAVTVAASVAVSLARLSSPPPETEMLLVTVAVAVAATFTVTLIGG
jgi:hypothetical protein